MLRQCRPRLALVPPLQNWPRALDEVRRPETTEQEWARFTARVEREVPRLTSLFTRVYGDSDRTNQHLTALLVQLAESWQERPADLRALDATREEDPDWFLAGRMLGGVCYVDR